MSYAGEEWRRPHHSSCREVFSHFCSCWTNNELRTSSNPLFTHCSSVNGVDHVTSPHLGREMCVYVCPRMHDCVWVFFGLKYEVGDCTSSPSLWEALLYLTDYHVCVHNCKASWVGKRFRSNGSPMKGTSRCVFVFLILIF